MKYLFFVLYLFAASWVFAEADLELESLQAEPAPDGRSLQLKLYMANHGPADASLLACNIYLLSQQKLLLSQTLSLNPLPNQEKRIDSIQVDLPKGTVTGVKVEIFDSQEPDFQPSSNAAQVSLKGISVARADVQILEASVKGQQPISDNAVVLHLRVRNNGPDPVGNIGLQVILLMFNSPVLTQQKRIGRIEAGKEQEADIPVVLNKTIPAADGVFQLNLSLDEDKVTDPVAYNNTITVPVQLTPRLPDLVIDQIKVNEKGNLAFFVQNKGNAPTELSETALYLNGALVQRYKTQNLKPQETQRFVYSATKLLPGTQVSVVADFNADVPEATEANNKSAYVVENAQPGHKEQKNKKPD